MLTYNGIYFQLIFKCLGFNFEMLTIGRYSPHKQKPLCGVFNNFKILKFK